MNFFEYHSKQTCGHMQHDSGICENGRYMHTPDGFYKSVLMCMKMSACMDVSSICMPYMQFHVLFQRVGMWQSIKKEASQNKLSKKNNNIQKVPNLHIKDPKTSVPNQLKNKPLKRHGKTVLPQISVET